MADFLIAGLMSHLHEFAWNEKVHADEIKKYGNSTFPNFPDYAKFLAAQMIQDFSSLKA
jgi:hypothetical protein